MKQKNIFNLFFISILAVAFAACNKADLNTHSPLEKDNVKPGVLTNIKVVNVPGGAIITYNRPADNDFQYAKAEYKINETVSKEEKSSRYSDTIIVTGFKSAASYKVNLFAVDNSENKSEAVEVTVSPLTPPYLSIKAGLAIIADFGGMTFTYTNPNAAPFALVVIKKDQNNEWAPIQTFYGQNAAGDFSIRGLDTFDVTIGAYVRDRWGNLSDTIFKTIKPLYETIMDKSKFQRVGPLPGDQPSAWGWEMTALWDKNITADYGFHTEQGKLPRPHTFTFDMGVVAKLSRFKFLQRQNGWQYRHGNMRKFIVWGTATTPNPDGSFTGWTKIGEYESIKPSGLPQGQNTQEDIDHARGTDGLGEEYKVPLSMIPVRYIRVQCIVNWSETDFLHVTEVSFFGQPQ